MGASAAYIASWFGGSTAAAGGTAAAGTAAGTAAGATAAGTAAGATAAGTTAAAAGTTAAAGTAAGTAAAGWGTGATLAGQAALGAGASALLAPKPPNAQKPVGPPTIDQARQAQQQQDQLRTRRGIYANILTRSNGGQTGLPTASAPKSTLG